MDDLGYHYNVTCDANSMSTGRNTNSTKSKPAGQVLSPNSSKCETGVAHTAPVKSSQHESYHAKPYKCEIPGCAGKTGFTTKNDLDRHMKSIYQVYTGKSYMCAAPHCAKKNKIWPRADNFRQHINRLHRDWEVQELMNKSVDLFEVSHSRWKGINSRHRSWERGSQGDSSVTSQGSPNLYSVSRQEPGGRWI